ncbi:hypothetical protein CI109_103753 [Kwoniella shandongensis]|uniref:Uncharacterized protein n=1 Tax=Kwoniella shandongensis TaxID=1734106 RepID=A0A5M6CD00_9TREE|nr:uncharacterized protein CI109_000551 [Kwoniella shandongensis]KAA5530979.1 hypothetical protein CI109_000551 [Kwoniella shandongensis]
MSSSRHGRDSDRAPPSSTTVPTSSLLATARPERGPYEPSDNEWIHLNILAAFVEQKTYDVYDDGRTENRRTVTSLNDQELAQGFRNLADGIETPEPFDTEKSYGKVLVSKVPNEIDLRRIWCNSLVWHTVSGGDTILDSSLFRSVIHGVCVLDKIENGENSRFLRRPDDRSALPVPISSWVDLNESQDAVLRTVERFLLKSGISEPDLSEYTSGVADLYEHHRAPPQRFSVPCIADEACWMTSRLPSLQFLNNHTLFGDQADEATKTAYKEILDRVKFVHRHAERHGDNISSFVSRLRRRS